MRPSLIALAAAGAFATAACGTSTAPVSAYKVPATVAAPGAAVVEHIPSGIPHFRTPEEAMRYLALAWNQRDEVALRHVTDVSARGELDTMHTEATDLQLRMCERLPEGDYGCHFTHAYPPESIDDQARVRGVVGQAWFRVGPAKRSGWYMTVLEECG